MVRMSKSFLINNTNLNLTLTHVVFADARFTGFKPSIVSAAAVLTAIADLHPKLIPLFPIFVKALKGMDKVNASLLLSNIHLYYGSVFFSLL